MRIMTILLRLSGRVTLDWPGNAEFVAYLLHRIDNRHGQRYSFASVLFHFCETLLPVHVDPVLSVCLRRVFQLVRKPIHVPLELVQGTERRGIDGHEKVSNVWFRFVNVNPQPGSRPTQDPTENINHERETVALVARVLFSFASKG